MRASKNTVKTEYVFFLQVFLLELLFVEIQCLHQLFHLSLKEERKFLVGLATTNNKNYNNNKNGSNKNETNLCKKNTWPIPVGMLLALLANVDVKQS